MKSYKQVETRLEMVLGEIIKMGETITEKEPTPEQKEQIILQLGIISALGWVLDMDQEIKEMWRSIKIAGVGKMLETLT